MMMAGGEAKAADFNITTPASFFSINGTNSSGNPTLTLVRGRTYTFAVSTASFHPFNIGTSVGGPPPPGVSGSPTSSGTVTFVVPTNAANCAYFCSVHFFNGSIVMIDPPAPPTIRIVNLKVGTNLTVTSTLASTNGLTLTPEFNTNLTTTNWSALTVQSNKFLNGTNEIICGKPAGNPVFLRLRAQTQ
ncbi:MAG: hypothetical protein EXS35_04460 [Pedosphaera sp.]|nr:hypothetical protein [Pedosphaera sp.]